MKLSEKIYYCRKKSGKSQETLAEQLGVSRQAISKWETGESEPEIGKLKLLADAFGVTADWLLSDEDPAEEAAKEPESAPSTHTSANWVDSIPGVIGTLLRRYGWLFGVYTAIVGAGFTLIGGLARVVTRRMVSSFDRVTSDMFGSFGGGMIVYDEFGNQVNNAAADFAAKNPVVIMGTVIMVIGIALIVSGVILAVVLKKRSKEKK